MRDLINKIFKTVMFRGPASKHWGTALVVLGVFAMVFIVSNIIAPAAIAKLCANGTTIPDNLTCNEEAGSAGISIEGGGGIWDIAKTFLGISIGGLIYIVILVPLGWLLGVAGTFAEWMLQPTYIINSTVVLVGWGVTRDLANMFFILILLGVALDYILFQSFGVKRALPMLIVVALLINFSLPIAGIFIDFSNVFSNFFMEKISGGCLPGDGKSCGFTMAIANNLNLTALYNSDKVANLVTDEIFSAFLMLGTIFTLFALGIMFLLRTGWLYALLILLPLVLVLMPFPKTSQYFGRWTHRFFQWTFFAPVALFFLYLSMLIFQANVNPGAQDAINPGSLSFFVSNAQAEKVWTQSYTGGFIEQVIKYVIVWFFMLGSLMAAQSMSITGAGAAHGMIKSAQKWAGGKVKSGVKRGAEKAGVAKILEKGAEKFAKAPIIGGFGARVMTQGALGIKKGREEAEALTASDKNILERGSKKQISDLIHAYSKGTPVQQERAAKMLAEAEKDDKYEGVRNSDGSLNDGATLALRNQLRRQAVSSNNFKTAKAIGASDHRVREHGVQDKFAKITTIRNNPKTGQDELYDVKTGKFKSDEIDDVYRDVKIKDIEKLNDNMPTTDLEDLAMGMIISRSLTLRHIQEAAENNKLNFLDQIGKYIKSLPGSAGSKSGFGDEGPPATGLYRVNHGLAKSIESSAGQAVIGYII